MINKEKLEVDWEDKNNIIAKKLKILKKLPLQLVETVNLNKSEEKEKIWKNKLIYGNNSLIMNSLIRNYEGKIDLLYLYIPNIRIEKQFWNKSNSLVEEFLIEKWNNQTEINYISSLYIQFFLMKRLLSGKGSIYAHVNKTNEFRYSIKIILDEIFGIENFQRELFWDNPYEVDKAKLFEGTSDNILYYNKSEKHIFNIQYTPMSQEELDEKYNLTDEQGRKYKITRRENIKYIEEEKGDPKKDILEDISLDSDITGDSYRDYKPLELIKLIIAASSNEGDLIADFNCFTGTGIVAAESLNRRWIGCVNNKYAVHLIKDRLIKFPNTQPFEIYNLGKYERQLWKTPLYFPMEKNKQNYLDFMLKLFNSNEKKNTKYLNGSKGSYLVFIADVDEALSQNKLELLKKELANLKQKKLKVLCWAKEKGVQNIIDEGYDIKILPIPEGILSISKSLERDVQFFENAYIDAVLEKEGTNYKIIIKDFGIPIINDLIIFQYSTIKNWSDLIDFWTVDNIFSQQGYNVDKLCYYRTKQIPELRLESEPFQISNLKDNGVVLKITDILGNTSFKKINLEDE